MVNFLQSNCQMLYNEMDHIINKVIIHNHCCMFGNPPCLSYLIVPRDSAFTFFRRKKRLKTMFFVVSDLTDSYGTNKVCIKPFF